MIWREKKIPLIVLAILLLANAVFFFTFRVDYQSRVRDLDERKQAAEQRLRQVREHRLASEQQYATYRKTQKDLQAIYNDRWATQPQRLTALINEVKRLATATDMVPPLYSFARSESETKNGIGTTTVSINFTVHGTYAQVRRLINLLELSDQFIIIEAVGLAGAPAGDKNATPLTMTLRLKTIFRQPPPTPGAARQL